jgi:hypothetical protein
MAGYLGGFTFFFYSMYMLGTIIPSFIHGHGAWAGLVALELFTWCI